MQRITITESDITKSGNIYKLAEAVFIPGFANQGKTDLPVFCENLDAFYAEFGTDLPTFASNQDYPVNKEVEGVMLDGFPEVAIPNGDDALNAQMFAAEECDPSYIQAISLLASGFPVVYWRMNTMSWSLVDGVKVYPNDYDVSVDVAYSKFKNVIFAQGTPISERGEYSEIKFLTSGGYPVFEHSFNITQLMATVAAGRGDCVALIDHTDNPERDLTGENSVYYKINNGKGPSAETATYTAMFTPWCDYGGMTGPKDTCSVPASFVYLRRYIGVSANNPTWIPIAGAARGTDPGVSRLHTNKPLTNTIAESYQDETSATKSINPITKINPYGLCIWGNKTLANLAAEESTGYATTFLNIRNLVSDVKKQARIAAQSCMFEQNTDLLWLNFKNYLTPLLDKMVSGTGLRQYKIVKLQSNIKTRINAEIRLYPIYSVESFTINVVITDEDVTVE